MPLYDYSCWICSYAWEVIEPINEASVRPCPECGGGSRRIISRSGVFNEDADWIRSVTEVVPKGVDASPIDKEFARNPTRSNLKAWMKHHGLRHMDPGEKLERPRIDEGRMAEKLYERHRERMRVEL